MFSNVMVTGGCGFIASNFLNTMKKRYPETTFINIDKLDYCSNVENVNPGVATFIKGNVGNKELVEHIIKKYSFDAVFHFAAQSHVDNSFENALSFTTDVPFTESEGVLRPTNPYSASKAAAEMIVRSYIESFGMNIKIIRCNNVYGPNQYPEKLIPKFKRLLKEGKKCTIHGKNCANIKRAFMHVEDVVDAVEIVWKRGVPGDIYNIASDDELTVIEVTHLIIETITGTREYDKWITYVEDRPFNDKRYYICADKLKSLGWCQKKTREDIKKFLELD